MLSDFKKCGKELALFGLEALKIPERAERECLLTADTAPCLSLFPASAEPLELCLKLLLHNLPLTVIELPRCHLKTAVVARALRKDKKCHALHQKPLFTGTAEPERLCRRRDIVARIVMQHTARIFRDIQTGEIQPCPRIR